MPRQPKPGRTLNPLHFEDLEPHRFEDLIRQLAYDFRPWSEIEATGRTGSDDGMDSRAYELANDSPDDIETASVESGTPVIHRRLWVIQAKRMNAFGPKDAKHTIEDIRLQDGEMPHGLIVAVPYNVSLATRRTFADAARKRGYQEFVLWGKGELEDQLFQPKNDHLLFAYFGVSLQVRRRSARSEQRAIVAMKRQLVKVLGEINREHFTYVMIREPGDPDYPFVREAFLRERPWWYYRFVEHWPPDILIFEVRKFAAYLIRETGEWDAIFDYDMLSDPPFRAWGSEADRLDPAWQGEWQAKNIERERFLRYYEDLPDENKATLSIHGVIPYDRILAIDELGDRVNDSPHLVVVANGSGDRFDLPRLIPKLDQLQDHFRSPTFAYEDKRN